MILLLSLVFVLGLMLCQFACDSIQDIVYYWYFLFCNRVEGLELKVLLLRREFHLSEIMCCTHKMDTCLLI